MFANLLNIDNRQAAGLAGCASWWAFLVGPTSKNMNIIVCNDWCTVTLHYIHSKSANFLPCLDLLPCAHKIINRVAPLWSILLIAGKKLFVTSLSAICCLFFFLKILPIDFKRHAKVIDVHWCTEIKILFCVQSCKSWNTHTYYNPIV